MKEDIDKIYLVGDVRCSEKAKSLYRGGSIERPVEFMLALQSLMEEFGVVKVDVSMDAFKRSTRKHQSLYS